APGELRRDAEVEPERAREAGVHEVGVQRPEEQRGERDSERGADAAREPALHQAAAEQLLGDARRAADAEQREPELAPAAARERLVALRQRSVPAQARDLEHAVEPVARSDGADHEQRLPAQRERARRETEPREARRTAERGAGERHAEQEDLGAEALERENLRGRGVARCEAARRDARGRSEQQYREHARAASAPPPRGST